MRPTDHARGVLRRVEVFLGLLVAGVAVVVGTAVVQQAVQPDPDAVVVAELLEPGPAPELAMVGAASPTAIGWTDPDGRAHTGLLEVAAGLPLGATVPVEIDAAGRLVGAVGDSELARPSGLQVGVATALGGWAVVFAAGAVWRSRLAARDSAAWATEWARVEPVWSGRAR
ncbi:hypothetical protein [Pseudonocardia nigra]|uniref:hypothetical protein n=1 Tax=Pseudonocardia nigra TaxID=1921578 RepID=UPI001C5E382E|nr:hypothetical protein [Pseudonocardia nigra]